MNNRIDLNQADRDTLAGLSGIGEKLADSIIEYRETVRPFTVVSDLTAISGISENMVQEIEDQVMVAAVPEVGATKAVGDPPKEEMAVSSAVQEVVEEDDTAVEEGSTAVEEGSTAVKEGSTAVKEGSTAVEEDSTVVKEDSTAVEEDGTAVKEGSTAVKEGSTAVEEDSTVVEEDSTAVEEDGTTDKMPVAPAVALEQTSFPPSPSPAPARSGFKELLFAAIAGALFGTVLTLAILWLLNGSLQLNETAQMSAFEQQFVQAATTTQAEQYSVRTDLELVSKQVSAMTTREVEITGALATAQNELETAHSTLADTIDEVATLETATDGLDKRITTVAASAENFDAFMVGMRDLLWALQGPPPSPEATTPTATSTTTATVTITPTTNATTTATPLATRTPRPTATPLGKTLPKATPVE